MTHKQAGGMIYDEWRRLRCGRSKQKGSVEGMSAVIRVLREIFISWLIRIFTANDIVRHEVLKLVIAEIYRREVPGCVAELGVYKGDFAKRNNIHFPDRKLFLFDTFDGFDERDVSIETGKGYMSKSMTQKGDFTNASI
jgi:hypothetical protein